MAVRRGGWAECRRPHLFCPAVSLACHHHRLRCVLYCRVGAGCHRNRDCGGCCLVFAGHQPLLLFGLLLPVGGVPVPFWALWRPVYGVDDLLPSPKHHRQVQCVHRPLGLFRVCRLGHFQPDRGVLSEKPGVRLADRSPEQQPPGHALLCPVFDRAWV